MKHDKSPISYIYIYTLFLLRMCSSMMFYVDCISRNNKYHSISFYIILYIYIILFISDKQYTIYIYIYHYIVYLILSISLYIYVHVYIYMYMYIIYVCIIYNPPYLSWWKFGKLFNRRPVAQAEAQSRSPGSAQVRSAHAQGVGEWWGFVGLNWYSWVK